MRRWREAGRATHEDEMPAIDEGEARLLRDIVCSGPVRLRGCAATLARVLETRGLVRSMSC